MNTLRQSVQSYLRMRRNLGFKLREAGKALLDFSSFMQRRRAPYITQALALTWAQQPANTQPTNWARRLSFVRAFARYRGATDPRTQVPPQGLLPYRPHRARNHAYLSGSHTGHEGAGLGQDDAPARQAREISSRRSVIGLSQQPVGSGLCRVMARDFVRPSRASPMMTARITKLQDIVRLGR